MKAFKFSGREYSVIRAIDFANGSLGAEILIRTRIEAQDALDILNGLLDAGYIETNPCKDEHVDLPAFYHTRFEINPAYAHEMKKCFIR